MLSTRLKILREIGVNFLQVIVFCFQLINLAIAFLHLIYSYLQCLLSLFYFPHELVVFDDFGLGCFLVMNGLTSKLLRIGLNCCVHCLKLGEIFLGLINKILHFIHIKCNLLNLIVQIVICIFILLDFIL